MCSQIAILRLSIVHMVDSYTSVHFRLDPNENNEKEKLLPSSHDRSPERREE